MVADNSLQPITRRKIMKENKLEEMRTLIEKLQIASSAYYNKQPIMNNYEYDLNVNS